MKKDTKCLNCHYTILESHNFCSNCGQKNNLNRYTIYNLIYDFLYSFVSYDSKLRTSVQAFLKQPGIIAKDFVNGKRARYVNPFRLYFTFSILLILIITSAINYDEIKSSEDTTTEKSIIGSLELEVQIENSDKEAEISFLQKLLIVRNKISTHLKGHPKATFKDITNKLQIEDHFINRLIFNKVKK
ncbi:MAG: DUF3667 domain-containing protein, partial [Flavobacteriales bacterium]